jgi:hypothetical protein
MDDRDARQKLIDELWPCPEPPPDLAARVLAGLAAGGPLEAPRAETPRLDRRPRRQLIAAASLAVAAAAALVVWWPGRRAVDEDGVQVAQARTTVDIGGRAAAALEPGAELQWSVRKRRAHVQQRHGSVFYRVERGGPFQVDTPAGAVEVTGTCFRVTLDGHAPRATTLVSVLEGTVNVSSGDGRLTLHAGDAARLVNGQAPVPVAAPDADAPLPPDPGARAMEEKLRALEQELAEARAHPTHAPAATPAQSALLLPASTRVQVHASSLDEVSLALPAHARGQRIEVARDVAFKHPVFTGIARADFVTVAAPGGRGDLYWRLAGQRALAGHARFLPDQRPPRGDAAHNVVSESRERTTIHYQSAPPALTLTFAAQPDARGYRVRLFRASEPTRTLFERIVREPRCAVEAGRLAEGRYTWTAVALDERGRARETADRRNELDLVYDNALAALAITRPAPEEPLAGSEVEVQGAAPLGARLYVNDRRVTVDEKGRFAQKIAGAPRVLVFRLVGNDGERFWIRGGKSAARISRR